MAVGQYDLIDKAPADLHRRQAEVKALLERCQVLHARVQPFRDAEELAAIAGRLGRTFEARAFLTLALAEDPDRPDLRQALERLERGDRLAAHAPGA